MIVYRSTSGRSNPTTAQDVKRAKFPFIFPDIPIDKDFLIWYNKNKLKRQGAIVYV